MKKADEPGALIWDRLQEQKYVQNVFKLSTRHALKLPCTAKHTIWTKLPCFCPMIVILKSRLCVLNSRLNLWHISYSSTLLCSHDALLVPYMIPYMTCSVLINWGYDLCFPGVCYCKLAATTREKLQDCCGSGQINALAVAFEKSSDLPRFSVLLQKTEICTVTQAVDLWLLVIWGQREGKR